MNQEWGGTAASPGGREGSVSPPSEGQELEKRVWRGVNRELLGWAAVSPAKSPSCVRACGIHIGPGSRAPWSLAFPSCSPSCTLSPAVSSLLLRGAPIFSSTNFLQSCPQYLVLTDLCPPRQRLCCVIRLCHTDLSVESPNM